MAISGSHIQLVDIQDFSKVLHTSLNACMPFKVLTNYNKHEFWGGWKPQASDYTL